MANLISMLRMLFAIVLCAWVYSLGSSSFVPAFWLTIAIIWMDGLDGYVARKLGESSKAGAVIDILCDRVVEQIYWVTFLALDWVPLWMVLTIITRGVLVDGLRSLALEEGFTAFGSTSMMQHPLGVLLVSSRFSRWSYAALKAVAFALLFLAHTSQWSSFLPVADACALGAVMFCVLRGLPVLLEAKRFLQLDK